MYLSCLCKSPWLLIRMCHHLGSAVLAALGSETLAVGVGTPGCGSIEVHSLLLWENLMLLHPHQGLSPPSSSTPWLQKQYHLPPPSSRGHHLQQVKVLLHPQSGSVSPKSLYHLIALLCLKLKKRWGKKLLSPDKLLHLCSLFVCLQILYVEDLVAFSPLY